ncbi:putative holin-like toxin [Enterococcus faecalis]|uniref:putative holin-like toxin n=1 Tax=Enterococcus faecalis TaxID=1351 RepID=UPI002DB9DD57|nr:putative holin-like toxin [Enterococcus faecalis]MEB8146421.1 putative holin-like toxin [Enterococcus faecalis]
MTVAIQFESEVVRMSVLPKSRERRSLLTVFEALSLMIAFATLVLMLNDKNNKK